VSEEEGEGGGEEGEGKAAHEPDFNSTRGLWGGLKAGGPGGSRTHDLFHAI